MLHIVNACVKIPIITDKGKPAERQGRKAKGSKVYCLCYDSLAAEDQCFLDTCAIILGHP